MSLKKFRSFLFVLPPAAGLLLQTGCQTTPAPADSGLGPATAGDPAPALADSGYDYTPEDSAHASPPENDSLFAAPSGDWETDTPTTLEPHPPVQQAELEPATEHRSPEGGTASTPIHSSHYTVVKDDTLWRIAQRSGISLNALRAANNLGDTDIIHPGQELVIPSEDTPRQPASTSTSSYRVERGDTLSGIALRFNTRVADIKALNNLESDLIRFGQRLELPDSEPAGASLSDPQEGLEEPEEEESFDIPDPVEETEDSEEEPGLD